MWDVTEWAVVTWLKTTAALAVIVAGCWLFFGAGSSVFMLACIGAVIAELHATRQLAGEWTNEASLRWWWR